MSLTHCPPLAAALLDVCAAVTYEDFADAAVRFCRVAVPHQNAEVMLNYLDFDADEALLVRGHFPSKRYRTPEEKERRIRATAPVNDWVVSRQAKVYRGHGQILPEAGVLEKSELYREIMVPEGWHDFLGMAFRSGPTIDSTIFINRGTAQPAFTPAEAAVFEEAYPYFQAALSRVRLLENTRAIRTDLESTLLDLPVATLLLDWHLSVEHANQSAARMCAAWTHGPEKARTLKIPARPAVPADLRAECAELKAAWSGRGDGGLRLLRRTLTHPEAPTLQATITLLRPHALRLAAPTFLIRITEVATAGTARGEHPDVSALLSRLTHAERELVPAPAARSDQQGNCRHPRQSRADGEEAGAQHPRETQPHQPHQAHRAAARVRRQRGRREVAGRGLRVERNPWPQKSAGGAGRTHAVGGDWFRPRLCDFCASLQHPPSGFSPRPGSNPMGYLAGGIAAASWVFRSGAVPVRWRRCLGLQLAPLHLVAAATDFGPFGP
jgi:hypothetical protein